MYSRRIFFHLPAILIIGMFATLVVDRSACAQSYTKDAYISTHNRGLITNIQQSWQPPGLTETARIAAQADAEKDPNYLTFREVFSDHDVALQRYRVTCQSGTWKLDWETIGTYSSSTKADEAMHDLVDIEAHAHTVVPFSRTGQ